MNFAEEIKSTLSLMKVIEFYTGESFKKGKISCPFHNEKTASFTVFPNNTYYCFGCGVSGDIFDFVKAFHNISFGQALLRINSDFGLRLPLTGKINPSEQIKWRHKQNEQNEAKRAEREKASAEYWLWFDRLNYLEELLKKHKPSSPEEMPHTKFIVALHWIPYAKYRLSLAEDERRRLCG